VASTGLPDRPRAGRTGSGEIVQLHVRADTRVVLRGRYDERIEDHPIVDGGDFCCLDGSTGGISISSSISW
jgi:hypothetical protein